MENLALLSNEELLEIISQAKAIIESRKEDKQFMVKTFESIDPRKNGHAYMARLSFADGKVSREFIDCNGKNWDRRFGIWSSKTRAASWYYSDLARYKSQRYPDKRA